MEGFSGAVRHKLPDLMQPQQEDRRDADREMKSRSAYVEMENSDGRVELTLSDKDSRDDQPYASTNVRSESTHSPVESHTYM